MTDRISNSLVGIAGVHYVVSELSRRGMVALPTVRNVAAYDILVANVLGTRHANVQVKASLRPVSFWPMPAHDKVRAGPKDFYVLVRWLPKKEEFEGYMLSGRQAREEVLNEHKRQAKRIKKAARGVFFPALWIGPRSEGRDRRWLKKWKEWEL